MKRIKGRPASAEGRLAKELRVMIIWTAWGSNMSGSTMRQL